MQADDGGEPEAVTMGCCNHGHRVLEPAVGELQSKLRSWEPTGARAAIAISPTTGRVVKGRG